MHDLVIVSVRVGVVGDHHILFKKLKYMYIEKQLKSADTDFLRAYKLDLKVILK